MCINTRNDPVQIFNHYKDGQENLTIYCSTGLQLQFQQFNIDSGNFVINLCFSIMFKAMATKNDICRMSLSSQLHCKTQITCIEPQVALHVNQFLYKYLARGNFMLLATYHSFQKTIRKTSGKKLTDIDTYKKENINKD